MGGDSESKQVSESKTEPWAVAQPFLGSMLNQLNGQMGQAGGLTENEAVGLSTIQNNAQAPNPFTGMIEGFAKNLLNGGGANAQAPALQAGMDQYREQLMPFASGSMVGNNSALKDQLNTISSDVQNRVNGMFAGAGRDMSGANVGTLARGIAEGTAPVIANQYNQDVSNQLTAAGQLYGAGNTTSGLLTGLNQQGLANQSAGVTAAQQAMDSKNSGAKMLLEAEAMRRGIPLQALGLLAQIGIPIAGLGGQSSGTQQGWNQESGAQQFGRIAGGIGAMMPKGPITF